MESPISILTLCLRFIPVLLPLAWIIGAFLFYWTREKKPLKSCSDVSDLKPISIIIPCHNEEFTIANTIEALDALRYPEYEILAVNDGSSDNTQAVLESLAKGRSRLRVINLLQNKGKAAALNIGIMASLYDYVLCIDADSELDPDAPFWLMPHLTDSPNVAAVTGNPRVKNRGTLIGRIQVGEFSAIIGMIKRYHQVIGKLFALSGVLVAFKKKALLEIGLLDTDCATEDIAVTWKLQRAGWDVRYEPRALCDVLMPDTLKGLWKQRMRWARGGFQVMIKNCDVLFSKSEWALKILVLEYLLSVVWTFMFAYLIVFGAVMKNSAGQPLLLAWFSPWSWTVFATGCFSLVQFLAGFWLHGRYERGSARFAYWSVWYPFLYWMLNSAVLMIGIPAVIFGKKKKFSTWTSPDRGELSYETIVS